MIMLGEVQCPSCLLETRILIEKENAEKKAVLIGDTFEEKEFHGHSSCDYCETRIPVVAISVKGVLSAFLTEQAYKEFQQGTRSIKKAKESEGLKKEQQKKLKQFHHTYTLSYETQPYPLDTILSLANQKWKVEKVFRKENVETDVVVRSMSDFTEEYCYYLRQIKNGKERWLVVSRAEENNAVLMQEKPAAKENELLCDISENPQKPAFLFEKELGEELTVKAFEQSTGIQLLVERQGEMEMDIYGKDMEEAMYQLDCLFEKAE